MSATNYRKLRNDEDTQDFTLNAGPARHGRRSVPEEGLSVDADELGERFLSDATEQGNFESELEPQLSLSGGSNTDEAMVDDDSDGSSTVWDHTVRRAPRSDVRELTDVAIVEDRGVDPDSPDDQGSDHAPRTVDVRQARVVGASLFDDEGDELGETRAPDVRADDQAR
jgi:hypothetical protein